MNEIQTIATWMVIVAVNILLIYLVIVIRKKIQKSIKDKRIEFINKFKIDRKYAKSFHEKFHLVEALQDRWPKDFPIGQIVVAVIGLGVILMVGFLILNQIEEDASTDTEVVDENVTVFENVTSLSEYSETLTFPFNSAIGLVAVSLVALAGFGLVNMFKY